MTNIIMLTIVFLFGILVLFRDKTAKHSEFFDLPTTNTMRGIWCWIVLLVHVPEKYQNTIQDMLGSFAYVGVTFFFLSSGYGLMLGIEKKGVLSLKGFWKRRLSKLLIPMILINILTFVSEGIVFGEFSCLVLISIAGFVRQLLLFYAVFWLVFSLVQGKVGHTLRIFLICVITVLLSVCFYVLGEKIPFGWPCETLGFAYGIILAHYRERIYAFFKKRWILKSGILGLLSLCLGVLYLKTKQIDFWGNYLTKIALGIAILACILCITAVYKIGNPVSRYFGKVSYEIFLIHGVAFTIVSAFPVSLNSGVFILVSMALTLMLSVFVNMVSVFLNSKFRKCCEK